MSAQQSRAILTRLSGPAGPFDAAALFIGAPPRDALSDLYLSPLDPSGPAPGEIYAARVVRALPDQGAAFLDLGDAPGYLPEAGDRTPGDAVSVAVTRAAEGRKAARVEARLSFSGRYVAHTPDAPGVNISRKLTDPVRRAALTALLTPLAGHGGWIARTAAGAASDAAVAAEATELAARAAEIAAAPLSPPRRLRAAPDLAEVAARLWSVTALDRRAAGPGGSDATDLAGRLDALSRPEAPLKPGGALRMARTEALIAIDVDSADASRAAVNAAAAQEIPRQLRLRGWGGMVAIDFAGTQTPAAQARLAAALRAGAGGDPLRVAGWGPLGLLEAVRRRDRTPIERVWVADGER